MPAELSELERLLLEGLEGGNAKRSVKALFDNLNARVDELEGKRKRGGKWMRSHPGRRPRGERAH